MPSKTVGFNSIYSCFYYDFAVIFSWNIVSENWVIFFVWIVGENEEWHTSLANLYINLEHSKFWFIVIRAEFYDALEIRTVL